SRGLEGDRRGPVPVRLAIALPRCIEHGTHDLRVRAAPAEIPTHPANDLLLSRPWMRLEKRDSGQDLPGRTVAALRGVVRHEGALHWVQAVNLVTDAFDGGDGVAIAGRCEREAGVGE